MKCPNNPTYCKRSRALPYFNPNCRTPRHWKGWSGGAMVLGNPPVPGRPTIWMIVGQGPIALAVGAGGGCLDIFSLHYLSFPITPSLLETVRYRLKYCLKRPLNPKQPAKQDPALKIYSASSHFPTRHWKLTQLHRTTLCHHHVLETMSLRDFGWLVVWGLTAL